MGNPAVTKQLAQSSLIALLAGLAFFYLLKLFWAYFPNYNPLFDWLLKCCASASWFHSVIWVHDIIVNLLLTLPVALLLLKLQPKHPWWYCALAIIPSFVWYNHQLFNSRGLLESSFIQFTPGLAMELFILPTALLILIKWQKRDNNKNNHT